MSGKYYVEPRQFQGILDGLRAGKRRPPYPPFAHLEAIARDSLAAWADWATDNARTDARLARTATMSADLRQQAEEYRRATGMLEQLATDIDRAVERSVQKRELARPPEGEGQQ